MHSLRILFLALAYALPFMEVCGMTLGKIGCRPLRKYTAQNYVQDGLIAMWDGIENAGWGVHDPAATTWVNLADPTQYELSLGLGSWTENSRRHTSYSTANPWCAAYYNGQVQNDVHVEVCCNISSLQGTNTGGGIIYRNRVGGISDASIAPMIASIVRVSSAAPRWNGATYGTMAVIGDNTYLGLHTWSTGARLFYLDAMQKAVSNPSTSAAWNDAKLEFFGRGNQRTYHTYGDIHCVRLYSRALTAEKIAANYAVDRARFGLPQAS